jgi:hypothetical protein
MASSRLAQASNQEGKLLLAIQAYKRGQVSSIEKASALYTVPHSTLYDRLKGRMTRENAQLRNWKLSSTEELSLIQWILSMDTRGNASRAATIQKMANIFLIKRDKSTTPFIVSKCWVNNFVKRYDKLESIFSRKYNYKRALYKDSKIICEWFNLV